LYLDFGISYGTFKRERYIEETNGLFRMYLADEGMFAFQSQVSQSDFFVKDKRNILSGIFYENYVADEFVMKDIPLFYWTGKNSHEFEFLLYNNGKVLPVDVKKDKGKLNSLDEFRSYNPKNTAIKYLLQILATTKNEIFFYTSIRSLPTR
jgi:hypothetical protein